MSGRKVGRTLLGITTVYPSARDIPFTIEYLAAELETRAKSVEPVDLVLLNAATILRDLSSSPKAREALSGAKGKRMRKSEGKLAHVRHQPYEMALDYAATKRTYALAGGDYNANSALLYVAKVWSKSPKTVEGYHTRFRKRIENELRDLLELRLDKKLTADDALADEHRALIAVSQEIRKRNGKLP